MQIYSKKSHIHKSNIIDGIYLVYISYIYSENRKWWVHCTNVIFKQIFSTFTRVLLQYNRYGRQMYFHVQVSLMYGHSFAILFDRVRWHCFRYDTIFRLSFFRTNNFAASERASEFSLTATERKSSYFTINNKRYRHFVKIDIPSAISFVAPKRGKSSS